MNDIEECGGKFIVICTVCGIVQEGLHRLDYCEPLDAVITESTPDIVSWEVPNGDSAS